MTAAVVFAASANAASVRNRFVTPVCVDPANSSCVATVQDAVNTNATALLFTVAAGTYDENVQINLKVKGTPQRRRNITIQGAGAGATIVDGGGLDSVFNIGPKTTLTLSGMTIQNGNAKSGVGGGVSALRTHVTVSDCVVSGNQAIFGGGVYVFGGGLDVENSTLSGNSATLGGGLYVNRPTGGKGRVITVGYGSATRRDSAASEANNLSFGGRGGVASTGFINGSTISGNTAMLSSNQEGGTGAGIDVANGELIVFDSTISGNTALHSNNHQSEGGGIANFGHSVLQNVTISANSADTGGGIYNDGHRVQLNNVTVADNSAIDGGGVASAQRFPRRTGVFSFCDIRLDPRSFRMSNSIIADNTATDSTEDYSGWLYSDGYNLIFNNSGCGINGDNSTDIIGADPLLQPLANNGGTTEAMALGTGSPALMAGNPATPNGRGNHCEATDQVGNSRPKGACDLGALQSSGVAASPAYH